MGDSTDFRTTRQRKTSSPELELVHSGPEAEILRCEYWVTVTDPSDNQGRHRSHRERCGKPGSRVAIVGTLCTAHAILCEKHAAKADFETYISTNGYAKDVVSKSADLKFRQERLPGTGVVKE